MEELGVEEWDTPFRGLYPSSPNLTKKSYSLSFLLSRLPKGYKLRFAVTPYDSFGNAGKPIRSDMVSL